MTGVQTCALPIYTALFMTEISLDDGTYFVTTNKSTTKINDFYVQVRIVDNEGKETYYFDKSFIVDNSKISKIILTAQSGSDTGELDLFINPYLCKIEDKDKFILPNKIAEGVFPLFSHAIDYCNDELQKKDEKITSLAIKKTIDEVNSIVISDSSNNNIVDLKLNNEQTLYMCGKNLADFNTYFAKAQAWTTTGGTGSTVITRDTINKTISFNSINSTGRSGINVGWGNNGIPISFLLGKTITISVDILTTDDCKFFLCNSCDNYKSTTKAIKANEKQRVSVTTTMPTDITKIQSTSVLFHIDGTITNVTLSNFQIELSSTPTSYEDYKESQTITNDTDLTTVHTYYPTTTIIADNGNFQLTYVADTKKSICEDSYNLFNWDILDGKL